MFTTVVFDFDGTIMNTNDVVIASWKHAYKTIKGIEVPEEKIIETFGEPILISMEREFPEMTPNEAVEIYRKYQEEHKDRLVKLFPGMDQLCKEVKARGYKTAIVTSRTRNSLIGYLTKFNMLEDFDVIVTCDDTKVHKPDPEPMLIALDKMGTKPEEALMVGDSMYDILCAKNAGCQSVLVGWALAVSQEDKVGPNAPEYFMEKPEDLFQII